MRWTQRQLLKTLEGLPARSEVPLRALGLWPLRRTQGSQVSFSSSWSRVYFPGWAPRVCLSCPFPARNWGARLQAFDSETQWATTLGSMAILIPEVSTPGGPGMSWAL